MRRSSVYLLVAVVAAATGLMACQKDEEACAQARTTDTLEAWNRYAADFPQGSCKNYAASRIDELRDFADCEQARTTESVEAWRAYKTKWPNGRCMGSADKVINAHERDEDCDKARQTDSAEGWRRFLAKWPMGSCADYGRRQILNREHQGAYVLLGEAKRDGNASPQEFDQRFQVLQTQAQTCYDQALAGDPHLLGSMVITVSVDEKGNQVNLGVINRTGDGRLGDCVAEYAKKLVFPSSYEYTTVTYTLEFINNRTSHVLLEQADLSPGCRQEVARSLTLDHLNPLQRCYRDALVKTPGLEGSLTLDLAVAIDGTITPGKQVNSSVSNELILCCTAALGRVRLMNLSNQRLEHDGQSDPCPAQTVRLTLTFQPAAGR